MHSHSPLGPSTLRHITLPEMTYCFRALHSIAAYSMTRCTKKGFVESLLILNVDVYAMCTFLACMPFIADSASRKRKGTITARELLEFQISCSWALGRGEDGDRRVARSLWDEFSPVLRDRFPPFKHGEPR